MHRVLCKHSRSIMDEMDGWITSVLQSREARQPRRPKRIFFSVIRNAGTGRLLPGSMKFRIRREEWILNAFVDQAGQLAIRYGRKLQKRVIGRRERLRVLLPRVQIGRVIFLTFPSPKVPISLATINCFSINEIRRKNSMDPRRVTFFSNVVLRMFFCPTRERSRWKIDS